MSFMAVPSNVDEDKIKKLAEDNPLDVENLALKLAHAKASAVSKLYPYSYVLGADQILECNGRLFDKPNSMAAAREQLLRLRGCSHRLVNGLCIVKGSEMQWTETAAATLTMRDFSDGFLDDYLAEVDESILTSVGGYQLESQGSQLFASIDGDYFTILGLPLLSLQDFLRKIHLLKT